MVLKRTKRRSKMGYQIALAWSEKSEKELLEMGFKKREVYMKIAPSGGGTSEQEKIAGDKQFFGMKNPPFQFVTTSYWGSGYD